MPWRVGGRGCDESGRSVAWQGGVKELVSKAEMACVLGIRGLRVFCGAGRWMPRQGPGRGLRLAGIRAEMTAIRL